MTEPATSGPGASGPSPQPLSVASGRDYWDLVLGQLRRRRSVWIAATLLALLYGVAIYAPFLAGDRPLYLQATDAGGYRRTLRLLPNVVRDLRSLVDKGAAGYQATEAVPDFDAALASQRAAVFERLRALREQLAAADEPPLDELQSRVDLVVAKAHSDREAALADAAVAVELAGRIKESHAAAEHGVAPEPGKTVTLEPFRRWPVLEAISRAELYLMVLWALVLSWPLWNRAVNRWVLAGSPEAIRHARRRKLAAMLLLPVLPCLFWSFGTEASVFGSPGEWAVGSADPFASSPYKEALAKGDMVAEKVVMPPIAFGLAEIHDAEYFRPPTWHWSSPITEEGYYERGARSRSIESVAGFKVPARPVDVRPGEPERNDGARHPLGADSLGRDVLARIVWGGRISLSVGLLSTVFLVLIGVIVGAVSGYLGGWVDVVLSRVVEIFQCFPPFFLILIVVAFLGPSITNIMIILGITRWPGVARLVRGEFLRLRSQDFVVASRALGVPGRRTIFRHILPNAMGPVLVAATFSVASGILTESALSFLGFGVQLPVPSWGSLLIESRSPEHWWIQIFPGLMIFVTVLLYNLLGEGVRDALDPRLKSA